MTREDDSFYSDHTVEVEEEFDSRHLRESKPKSGGTGKKILFIVLGIFGVMMLLCCGGAFWFMSKIEEPKATSNPTEIREITQSILEFDVPERYEPQQAVTMDLVLMQIDNATFSAKVGESMLVLMRMDMPIQEAQMEDAKRSMQTQAGGQTHLENFKSESKTYTVDGHEISVVYTHGTRPQGQGVPANQVGEKWYSAQTILTSKKDLIMLMINGPEAEFDQAEIETMIQSIRFPE